MKLRQKLAVVLASAMVITAVPVTTMAASTNGLTHTVSLVKDATVGYKVASETTGNGIVLNQSAPQLTLQLTSTFANINHTFYVNAVDAKFNEDAFMALNYAQANSWSDAEIRANEIHIKKVGDDKQVVGVTAGGVYTPVGVNGVASFEVELDNAVATVTYLSETQIEVYVQGTEVAKDEVLKLPLLFKATGEVPALEIMGKNSPYSTSKVSLVTGEDKVGDKALAVKAADAVNLTVDGGEIAKITVEEVVFGALNDTTSNGDKNRTVTVKIPNSSDLEFSKASNVQLKGTYALAAKMPKGTAPQKVEFVDGKEVKITIPATAATGNGTGAVEITGLVVKPEGRGDAALKDLNVTVKGEKLKDTTLKVATIKDFEVELLCKEPVAPIAGKDAKKVTVNVNEAVEDVINRNDELTFELNKGYIYKTGVDAKGKYTLPTGTNGADVIVTEAEIIDYLIDEEIVVLPDALEMKDIIIDADGFITGFEAGYTKDMKSDEANKLEVKLNVMAKLGTEGESELTVSNRGLEDMTVKVADIKAPVTVVSKEDVTLKVGLKGQVGGEIVITETDKEMFERNGTVVVSMAGKDGITIKDAKVEAKNVKIDTKVKGGSIEIEIERTSDEAAEIKISEIEFDVDRTTPEGTYGVTVAGDGIITNKNGGELEIKKFITIGTKNTEDLPNAAAAKEIVLAVGSTSYKVNGVDKTADAAAFIDANNRTMVPVRFVAEEFGKIDFGTVNGVGTVTVFKDGAVLQFQNGSNIMNKNGIAIPMDTNVVIKDGRTYVPFKYVADGLGINYSYDAATKTITFTNQVK